MRNDLPPELERLAKAMAVKFHAYLPRQRYDLDDVLQEARIAAYRACRDFDGDRGTSFTAFATQVMKYALVYLLRHEYASKRSSQKWDVHLDDYGDRSRIMFSASFEDATISRMCNEALINELKPSEEVSRWADLVAAGYTNLEADTILGHGTGWGMRQCSAIASRYRKAKLRQRMAAEHANEVQRRAEPIMRQIGKAVS